MVRRVNKVAYLRWWIVCSEIAKLREQNRRNDQNRKIVIRITWRSKGQPSTANINHERRTTNTLRWMLRLKRLVYYSGITVKRINQRIRIKWNWTARTNWGITYVALRH